jgi:hypothetical protein
MTSQLEDTAEDVVRFFCETCLARVEIAAKSEASEGF